MQTIETTIELAKSLMVEQGMIQPTFFATTDFDEHYVIPLPMKNKNIELTILKILFLKHMVKKYVYFSEAWYSAAETQENINKIEPSKDPKRKEAIIVGEVEDDNKKLSIIQIITKKPLVLGEQYSAGTFSGRFAELLLPKETRLIIQSKENWRQTVEKMYKEAGFEEMIKLQKI